MNSRWKQYLLSASLIVVGGGLIFILIETVKAKNTGFETKTLWDWMQLLIIPLFLAVGAIAVNRSEKELERQRAEDRAKLEREIATDRQQEAVLQAYLDRMSELLLQEKLRTSKNKEVRDVARIRTLTALRGLDAKRKGMVLLFLYEAKLINRENGIVDLTGADLSTAILADANLEGADLRGADLTNAELTAINLKNVNLKGASLVDALLDMANLESANLEGTFLADAILYDASLCNANLQDAYVEGADLLNANLIGANISNEQLAMVRSLEGATMPDGTKHD